jgi:hypothetical protein
MMGLHPLSAVDSELRVHGVIAEEGAALIKGAARQRPAAWRKPGREGAAQRNPPNTARGMAGCTRPALAEQAAMRFSPLNRHLTPIEVFGPPGVPRHPR